MALFEARLLFDNFQVVLFACEEDHRALGAPGKPARAGVGHEELLSVDWLLLLVTLAAMAAV